MISISLGALIRDALWPQAARNLLRCETQRHAPIVMVAALCREPHAVTAKEFFCLQPLEFFDQRRIGRPLQARTGSRPPRYDP